MCLVFCMKKWIRNLWRHFPSLPTSTSQLVKHVSASFKFRNNLTNCNIPVSISSHHKLRTTRRHQLCYQQLMLIYDDWMQETTQRIIKLLGLLLPDLLVRNVRTRRHSKCYKTKLIARLVLRQKGKIYWPIFQLAELVFFRASTKYYY